MSTDVFASDQASESVLDTLVGEGKKFDNVEALAAGKLKSDEHIATIEAENAALKEAQAGAGSEENANASVSELLAAIKAAQAAKEGTTGEPTMSKEDLEEAIRSVVKDDKSAATKATNRAQGNTLVLAKVDGNVEAARLLVAERAAELNMTPKALAELSESSPTAFAKLIDPDGSTASSGSLSQLPGQRTEVLDSSNATMEIDGFKTKAWFSAKKTEVGHVKYINDQTIQRELTRSMNGLGERFNN